MTSGQDERKTDGSAAGPVPAGDPPPPAVAKASSGTVPPAGPPAEEPSEQDASGPAAQAAAASSRAPADRAGAHSPAPTDRAGGGSDEGQSAVEKDLDALLADTQRERDEYLDLAKRTKADFENFRKRMAAENQAALARGKSEVIRGVVPVLDDLERAIQAAGLDPEGDSEDGLAHGVLLVFRSLREALTRNGIEAVDPSGERFDPQWHEALSTQPGDGAEPGTIVAVMQKGYRLGEQLIRPARVVVAE